MNIEEAKKHFLTLLPKTFSYEYYGWIGENERIGLELCDEVKRLNSRVMGLELEVKNLDRLLYGDSPGGNDE